jgi:tetratricopeptide (TPR) repeat protein
MTMLLRPLCLAALMMCASIPASADIPINPAGRELVDAARQLQIAGNVKAAYETLVKAAAADTTSSLPMHMIAGILYDASAGASGEAKNRLSKQAQAAAQEALRRNERDPVAQELLRKLLDEQTPDPLHRPTAEASALLGEGEKLFQQKRYGDALAKYEAAAQADPLYSTAWVYAGDCFFVQRQWPEAEQRFLKATQIEPLNSQAWRFLADALERQGRFKEVERALYAAIAAHPSQLPNWDKLAMYMASSKLTLTRFGFVRKASVTANQDGGKREIELQRDFAEGSADGTFWVGYGLGLIAAQEKNSAISPYALELAALGTALEIDRESLAKGERPLSDPALTTLRKLYAERQLEAAILLLMYRESYRPEFEKWKLANPNGVPTFVAAYGLRP